ncbi:hypothetical protein ACIGKQ_16565 [Gordonia sp. NPDC062954]|uniref:hypothetical protein n=1 Tax=unclassified Gordonia (in: high G+C Gram-positive bacteria) TaxID=2657482 RepID=UPI000C352775|nr:hypothetical protein [Gordonia sp. (in: high G+C Gram-positive bacteria)]MAU83407.1 hypothetical protein [Gordonia sp. (in: high G+C Gram-positive bacteria)]
MNSHIVRTPTHKTPAEGRHDPGKVGAALASDLVVARTRQQIDETIGVAAALIQSDADLVTVLREALSRIVEAGHAPGRGNLTASAQHTYPATRRSVFDPESCR